MAKLDWQTAGDIHRNTKSLELWDGDNNHIADITRYDDTNQLKINTYANELDIEVVEKMIALARKTLGEFEDGTSLDEASTSDEILP